MPNNVKIIQGIPFVVDGVKLYAYETKKTDKQLYLGTYDPEKLTYTLVDNWKELYEPIIKKHRQDEKPRSRLPTTIQNQIVKK